MVLAVCSYFLNQGCGVVSCGQTAAEGQQFYVMECTLTVESSVTDGKVTTEHRAELNGYLSKEVLESALDMMREVVSE